MSQTNAPNKQAGRWLNRPSAFGLRVLPAKSIDHVNRLHEGVEAQIDKQDLHQLVEELYEYTSFHFASEEKLMKQYGMDHFKKHNKEHELFLKHLKHVCNAISQGKRPAFYSEYDVSNDWFLAHIMDFDKKMGAFLNNKGVY